MIEAQLYVGIALDEQAALAALHRWIDVNDTEVARAKGAGGDGDDSEPIGESREE